MRSNVFLERIRFMSVRPFVYRYERWRHYFAAKNSARFLIKVKVRSFRCQQPLNIRKIKLAWNAWRRQSSRNVTRYEWNKLTNIIFNANSRSWNSETDVLFIMPGTFRFVKYTTASTIVWVGRPRSLLGTGKMSFRSDKLFYFTR